jgi:hypothetical protein
MAAVASLAEVTHHGCAKEVPKQGCNLQLVVLALSTR